MKTGRPIDTKSMHQSGKRVNIWLREHQIDIIERLAKAMGASEAAVIRVLLEKAVEDFNLTDEFYKRLSNK